jgi:ABC-2 type transport system ATP-binding protein
MNNVVELQDVEKRYRRFTLSGLNACLPEGEILGLIGPNGAGKTTTLRILLNLVRIDSGKVRLFGLDHQRHNLKIKRRVGFVSEEPRFYDDRTVAWTGDFVSGLYPTWDTNLYQKLIGDFSLSRTKKIRELSKGMRVKLSLVLALAHRPELLILDEPTAGLDPIIRRELLEMLRKENHERGTSVIISSHITDDITRIADRIIFLIAGRIALTDEKDQLLSRWKRIHYQEGALAASLTKEFFLIKRGAFGFSGLTNDFPGIRSMLDPGLAHETVKVENITLDDILIALVKEGRP